MEQMPGVSVVCNVYNHEKYIRDALDGFVMQKTSFPVEVLIHDDASTDRTAEIIREYERKYPELIKPVYEEENQYSKDVRTIRRIQRERIRGKYVALCEGDDYWTDPLKLQKQFDFMEQNPDYTLCGCSTDWLNMLTRKIEARSKAESDHDITLEEFLLPKNSRPFPTVSFFMKSEIFTDLPAWGFPVGDLPTTYFAAIRGKVRMMSDTMCVYRWNAAGSWTVRNAADPKKRAKTCEKMIAAYERMNSGTEYRYAELIQKKILWEKYLLALMNRDFKAIRSEELIGIYRSRSFKTRLSDRIRCYFPHVFRLMQKMMRRIE